MKRGSETWKRRAFIQSGLWAAAGAGATGSLLGKGGAPEGAAAISSIPVRRFGKTGLTLPILGFGGSALVYTVKVMKLT